MSETSKQRQHTTKYTPPGTNGVDLASGGDAIVPWAISFDLPPDEYMYYNTQPEDHPERFQWRGHVTDLPFKDDQLDWVYASHILEDFLHWEPVMREWVRVLKPGGNMIIMVPEIKLWDEAIKRGQMPNCLHRHEAKVGELSTYADALGLDVVEDRLTNSFPNDYNILFVAKKR